MRASLELAEALRRVGENKVVWVCGVLKRGKHAAVLEAAERLVHFGTRLIVRVDQNTELFIQE